MIPGFGAGLVIETRSLPALTHVLPPTSTFRFAHLCRSRPRGSIRSLLPLSFYVDHSHGPVLAPATLAALPSTRAIPDRDVFYVAHPIRSIRSKSLLTLKVTISRPVSLAPPG